MVSANTLPLDNKLYQGVTYVIRMFLFSEIYRDTLNFCILLNSLSFVLRSVYRFFLKRNFGSKTPSLDNIFFIRLYVLIISVSTNFMLKVMVSIDSR